jgi:glycosyltransferase involved in cell wall biosynthesis
MPADVRFPLARANGVQIVKTAAALARAGCEVELVVRQSDPRPTREVLGLYGLEPAAGLRVRRLAVGHRTGAHRLPRLMFLTRVSIAAVAALRRGAVVYTRDLQLAEILLRLGARRVVYEAHAVEALMYAERGALYGTMEQPDPAKQARIDRRERRVWRGAGGVVTTTAGIRDGLAERHGPRERVRVVPNGCDVPAQREFPGMAGPPPTVVYAGQLYPWKGVDVLVEAMVDVPGARLIVLGGLEGEPDLERVRALATRCGLEGRCEFRGTVAQSDVAAVLEQAHVVAVPFLRTVMTERHTSPLKAFEALAAGRAVVVSDLPSSREFLRDGENALLTPPGDAGALSAALRRVLDDPALAERLARAAWDSAPEHSWDARARGVLGLLRDVA